MLELLSQNVRDDDDDDDEGEVCKEHDDVGLTFWTINDGEILKASCTADLTPNAVQMSPSTF